MNKKLLAVLVLLIVAVSMSTASASFLDDIFGSRQNVKIGDIDFSIPKGYNEDSSVKEANDLVNKYKSEGYNISFKTFVKDNTNFLGIGVMNVNNTQFNQSVLETNKTTIENVTGSLTVNNDGSCLFAYLDPNNKTVVIISNSKENIVELFKA